MQNGADQICWVPIGDILTPEEGAISPTREENAVLLASRGDGRYNLLAGEAELESVREQGRCYIAAVISPGEQLEQRLSDLNDRLVRGRLPYLEEAEAYRELIRDHGLNAQQLSQRTGRSLATVRKKIRLLNLGEEICALLRQYQLSERIAETLLRLPGQQGRLKALTHIIDKGLDAKAAEALVDDVLARMPVPVAGGRRLKPLMRDYRLYLNAIRGIVEQMQDAGLDAVMKVNVGKAAVDVRISVPLFTVRES